MQRRDFGWFHPLGRLNLAALAAGMLGIVGGCTGTIGPERTGGGGAVPEPVLSRRPASGPGRAAPAFRAARDRRERETRP